MTELTPCDIGERTKAHWDKSPLGGRGREGVLLYYHIHFFSRKLNIFWGLKILWIFFGGLSLYLEVISMHFRVFPECQGSEWRIFLGLLKFQIFILGS